MRQKDGTALLYPEARRSDVVDNYHGVLVPDPYRWPEDPDSPETRAWMESWLAQITERDRLRARLVELWNYARCGLPVKKGHRYFFTRTDGLQNQDVPCIADRWDGELRVRLDPNTLAPDGTTALMNWSVSEDGKFLAYSLSEGGSDWHTISVRPIETGQDLPDRIEWVRVFGFSWSHDHPFKCAAALHEARAGAHPVLIRRDTRAGHGMGKSTKMLIDEIADK
jgi:prolyl oligopeptidase